MRLTQALFYDDLLVLISDTTDSSGLSELSSAAADGRLVCSHEMHPLLISANCATALVVAGSPVVTEFRRTSHVQPQWSWRDPWARRATREHNINDRRAGRTRVYTAQ